MYRPKGKSNNKTMNDLRELVENDGVAISISEVTKTGEIYMYVSNDTGYHMKYQGRTVPHMIRKAYIDYQLYLEDLTNGTDINN